MLVAESLRFGSLELPCNDAGTLISVLLSVVHILFYSIFYYTLGGGGCSGIGHGPDENCPRPNSIPTRLLHVGTDATPTTY